MAYWLFSQIRDKSRKPQFAVQSTLNWMDALRYEIDAAHGTSAADQFASCASFFRVNVQPTQNPIHADDIFEPLFSSLNYCSGAILMAETMAASTCVQPTAIVNWYYSVYSAARSMFAAVGQSVGDNHASAANAFAAQLRQHLPHPLNMVATHNKNQDYSPALPTFPSAQTYDLQKAVSNSRPNAQGMLVQYLKGTATYYVDRTKETLNLPEFRTAVAKAALVKKLRKQIGFLHCAFRYRGKANYRDAIYLTYGSRIPHGSTEFLDNLATVSRFVFLCAAAFAQRHAGAAMTADFSADLRQNLRGLNRGPASLRFWEGLF